MNLWKTLGLLVAFGLLLAYSLIYEKGEAPDPDADRSVVELMGLKGADSVSEVSVQGASGTFTLLRQPADKTAKPAAGAPVEDAWEITAPVKAKGDSTAINAYVKALLTTKVQSHYREEDAAKLPDTESGLDKPTKSLILKDDKGKTATLLIGGQTPGRDGYYARVQGKKDLLVFTQYFVDENIANKKLGDLRDKTLLAFSSGDVKKLTLKYPARSITLEKRGEGWVIAGKPELPADSSTIDSMLSTLTSTRIEEFVDPMTEPGTHGLDRPRVEVILGLGDKGENGLLLGDSKQEMPDPAASSPDQMPQEKLYVQRKGDTEILLVQGTLYDTLFKNESDLRDKTVMALHPESATRLEYTLDGKSVLLEKAAPAGKPNEPATWQLRQPQTLPADQKVVEDTLSDLNLLRATAFHDNPVSLAPFGLVKPRGRMVVTESGKALPALLIGGTTADKANAYVMREGGTTVMEVRASFVDDLELEPNRLRDLMVAKLDRAQFKHIALRQANGDLLTLKAVGADAWEVEKPEKKKADPGRVAAVITALTDVHADEYVTDKATDLKVYGLDKPTVTATVTLSDGRKETIYAAQDPQGGLGAYLKRKGHDAIYKSDNGLILTDLQKKSTDFEPLPEPSMPMGMPPM
ncbi:MAG: DUF4340 domain-containing protein [Armatimonadetes bacterium]|nr:DUF4340 domain-containing protein [Armatimonadota bacterium]